MKRLKIVKSYVVLWLFIYFMIHSNFDSIIIFFKSSLSFNIAVLTLMVIGIIVILKATVNLVMLAGTFGTLAYKKDNLSFYLQGIDKIMPANIAHMFHTRAEKGVLLFTAEESRAVVEWIDEKFSHQNRYINYFTGTVLMIGLLGTFSGLLVAIDEMGRIILSLTGDIDLGEVIRGFSGPLGGMAVGFGSSLFGVVAAIIMGVMGYILNKNQEMLVEGVEDWLKGRIIDAPASGAGMAPMIGGSDQALPEQRSSFMDVFVDTIGSLTKEMANIARTNDRLHTITVASVQAARDEHEQSYEMFERINNSILSMNDANEKNAKAIEGQLTQQLGSTNALIDLQKQNNAKVDADVQTLLELLQQSKGENEHNLKQIATVLLSITDKLSSEHEAIEKLKEKFDAQLQMQKSSYDAAQKQIELMSESDTSINTNLQNIQNMLTSLKEHSTQQTLQTITKLEEKLNEELEIHKTSQEEIKKHNDFLQSVVENSHESLATLQAIASKQGANTQRSSGFFARLFK